MSTIQTVWYPLIFCLLIRKYPLSEPDIGAHLNKKRAICPAFALSLYPDFASKKKIHASLLFFSMEHDTDALADIVFLISPSLISDSRPPALQTIDAAGAAAGSPVASIFLASENFSTAGKLPRLYLARYVEIRYIYCWNRCWNRKLPASSIFLDLLKSICCWNRCWNRFVAEIVSEIDLLLKSVLIFSVCCWNRCFLRVEFRRAKWSYVYLFRCFNQTIILS